MSKIFEALKRAEKENGVRFGVSSLPPVMGKNKSFIQGFKKWSQQDIFSQRKKSEGFYSHPQVIEAHPIKKPLPLSSRLKKLKNISTTTEEYRKMKYRILNRDSNQIIKTVLFCGSNRGDGNSTVLLHFAQTLAADGYRVLLVDANLRDPFLHKLLHLERENGLTDLSLRWKHFKDITTVIKKTMLNNLWVITSGNPHPNPVNIFRSDFFDSWIEQMKGQGDWVLFDSPPPNVFSDSIALAAKVDGVVLVIEAEKTRWKVIQNTRELLENGGGNILGVVLNKRHFYIPDWLYKTL